MCCSHPYTFHVVGRLGGPHECQSIRTRRRLRFDYFSGLRTQHKPKRHIVIERARPSLWTTRRAGTCPYGFCRWREPPRNIPQDLSLDPFDVAGMPYFVHILPYCQSDMRPRPKIIVFLVASPFELLDLA